MHCSRLFRTILGERNSSQIHSANDEMDTSLDDSSYINPIECEGPILEAKYASFTPIRWMLRDAFLNFISFVKFFSL